jgi:hypothetical protein
MRAKDVSLLRDKISGMIYSLNEIQLLGLERYLNDALQEKTVMGKDENTITYFHLKTYERFEITGKGTVFTVHRDDNDVEGIRNGDMVMPHDGGMYEVRGIEAFKNNFGETGKNLGLLVKKIETG